MGATLNKTTQLRHKEHYMQQFLILLPFTTTPWLFVALFFKRNGSCLRACFPQDMQSPDYSNPHPSTQTEHHRTATRRPLINLTNVFKIGGWIPSNYTPSIVRSPSFSQQVFPNKISSLCSEESQDDFKVVGVSKTNYSCFPPPPEQPFFSEVF